MSLRLEWLPEDMCGDIALDANGLSDMSGGMETAVLISLASDARADDGDELPESASKRGWWGDSLADEKENTGSKLWLLDRSKMTAETIELAKSYTEDALQWLIDDEVAKSIEVTAERATSINGQAVPATTQILLLRVIITKSDDSRWDYVWRLIQDGI